MIPKFIDNGWAAHPRVSGENPGGDTGVKFAAGSSPRERGKPLDPTALVKTKRLIPA